MGKQDRLCHRYLTSILDYSPESGVFTWLKKPNGRIPAGSVAGTKDHNSGYILIRIKRIYYQAHRLAWFYVYGQWPHSQIDHINGVRADNRLSNIREASNLENQRNRKLQYNSTTGIPGVSLRENGKWRARINDGIKRISLGDFPTLFDAACARKSAEKKIGYHSNHGRT